MRRITLTKHQQEVLEAIHARRRGMPRPRSELKMTTNTGDQAGINRILSARAATAYLSWLRKTRGR